VGVQVAVVPAWGVVTVGVAATAAAGVLAAGVVVGAMVATDGVVGVEVA
jgi:hypothetical protein